MEKVVLREKEKYSELTKKCLAFLEAEGGKETSIGKHYTEDGSGIYFIASEGNTKDVEAAKWEAHRKYVDLQVALVVEEAIKLADLSAMEVLSYDENRDFVACKGEASDCVLLNTADAFYLFPEDAHMPGLSADGAHAYVKKVCFKIPVECFE